MCLRRPPVAPNMPKTPTRSPYRRHLREPMKPKLSRKVVPSARVNLNSYWSKFEELENTQSSTVPRTTEVVSSSMYSTFYDNEINENLVNELLEMANK